MWALIIAFLEAIVKLPDAIEKLVAAIEQNSRAKNIQEAHQISSVDIPDIKTTEDAQAVAKKIQDLVSKS